MNKEIEAKKNKLELGNWFVILLLSIIAILQIFPFYLQIVTSLQLKSFIPDPGKIYLIPSSFAIGNYIEAINRVELLQGVMNSIIVAVGFTLISGLIILDVGYVLGKKKFKGRKVIMFALLVTMVVPGEMLMVTNYKLISEIGWINTYAGLILPGIVNITGIFLVMSFMNTIPNAVLESADIDGETEIGKLFRIVLPMTMPVMSTYAVLTFVAQWNDYLWPMVITSSRSLFTIQLKLKEFNPFYTGYADEILKSAALIFTIIPVVMVYVICQGKFVSGISISGMK